MGSCASPSAKGDDKFITTDYLQQCQFEHMWSTLKSGRSWMGLVKNRCKNGDHYWVSAYVTPIAKNGSIVEYQSVRTKPEPEQVLAAEKLYAQLRSGKAARPKLAASFSVKILLLIWGSII
ncbi:PAS domain-containing protein, partial [Klebsiella pneumoniae]|uniref:PAS domain-containing protein n=1 Tax=Klebsiella pneumoniae TaxID=573 RepID=UPI0025A2B357